VLLAVDRAGAFKVVLLMRMGPVPFSVCNYTCSIPPTIRLLSYLPATFVGLTPYNILEVYLGENVNGIAGGAAGALPGLLMERCQGCSAGPPAARQQPARQAPTSSPPPLFPPPLQRCSRASRSTRGRWPGTW
jgi:hypothetical protein